jgi:hypothetical protein
MKQMKKIQKYCINEKGGKIPSGAIEYHYDEQQLLTHKKIYDDSVPKITTILYNKDGNEVVRKIGTMLENGGFSLSWNISTYDESGKLVKDEGCLDGENEQYENLYQYAENGDLSEEVWTKGNHIVRIKYKRKGELYEGESEGGEHHFKMVKNQKMKNILTETHDKEGIVLHRDIYEDIDANGNPGKLTKRTVPPLKHNALLKILFFEMAKSTHEIT